jgi:hypothetical protein
MYDNTPREVNSMKYKGYIIIDGIIPIKINNIRKILLPNLFDQYLHLKIVLHLFFKISSFIII